MIEDDTKGARPASDQQPNRYGFAVRAISGGALLVLVVLFIAAAYLLSQEMRPEEVIRQLGPIGITVLMFFSSATVLLPAPGLLAVLGAGASNQFNPLVIGVFAGLGSSLGELTGYLVGLGGRRALHLDESRRWLRRCEFFMRRWGFLTVFVLAAIPNPAFDLVGIIAGSLGYSPRRMWIACFLGNTLKATLVAMSGGAVASFFFGLLRAE